MFVRAAVYSKIEIWIDRNARLISNVGKFGLLRNCDGRSVCAMRKTTSARIGQAG